MTRLMRRVIDRLRAVPEPQQDQLAEFLLHELEEDERWSATTASHTDALRRLSDRILEDDAKGRTEPLDPERT
jgi:hypothetical protein